ncbi:MAG: hypothetical protein IPP15_01730 [Saprospiraceae bacterium]|uniref:Lipoprotein n=1 Tax=Candidatus Opimibacter skivensis TaxID=2982028 RepID=A0A9D7SSP0_9BACT|nr:hypothetical protein [Candidatus Opimibacter skivensis]
MKSNCLFLAILAFLLFYSCKSAVAPVQSKTSCLLEGKYLNYTVLEHCPDILPGQVPNFALEIDFKHKDTIDLFNGFERFRMAYTGPTDSCTYTIKDATQFGDMKFRLQGDTIIRLYDSAWTQLKTTTIFRRIDDSKPWGFANYLNECVLVGTWNLIKEGAGKDHKVIFLRNGQVDGMKPYLSYEICYAGDCLEETEPFSNTINLLDDHNQYTTFSFVITPGRRTIKFYSIGKEIPDQKGGRKIGALAFELQQ